MKHSAKFAFFYVLSLIALVFVTTSVGTIAFQLINKLIAEVTDLYGYSFSLSAIRFALSALLVGAPVYFFTVWRLNLNITKGDLPLDSGVRKWLSYFILLVASVVLLGFLIGVFNSFLEGELTTRFILKFLSVFIIAGIVIWYYLHDILRSSNKFDGTMKSLSIIGLAVVIASFIVGLSFIDSPKTTRLKNEDNAISNNLSTVQGNLNQYYDLYEKLPSDLSVLISDGQLYIREADIVNPVTKEPFSYRIVSADSYELCTRFNLSNKEEETKSYDIFGGGWIYEAGENCFTRKVSQDKIILR